MLSGLTSCLQVMTHLVGSDQSNDCCLLHEACESSFLELTMTKDWKYILLNSSTKNSSQVVSRFCYS